MYLKYFLESGIFAQDSKDSESRTLFYFVTDPSGKYGGFQTNFRISFKTAFYLCEYVTISKRQKLLILFYNQ